MSGQFKFTRWDPVLIISQIVAIQATFYFSFGLILFILSHLFGHFTTIDLLFNYQLVNFKTSIGLIVSFSMLINAFLNSLSLYYIVKRGKKCLDFTLTLFIIHILFVWIYSGQIPSTFSWWFLITISVTSMCICGEYLCFKSELKAIPLLVSHKSAVL